VHAGYRVIVPDMLGYGGTDKPLDVEEYSTQKLCADLAALLDVVGVSKAVSTQNWDHSESLIVCR
jgi:soluble epoxide hydrolase / lipid-phosphate phosphatase